MPADPLVTRGEDIRALGLDVGARTIGVAISDALGIAAHPVTTIARRGIELDATAVATLVRDEHVTDIVVGLPLELSGQAGRRAARVRKLTDSIAARLGGDVNFHEWDERFSTAATERVLIAADLSRRRRKQIIDKQAAAYILQGWLDARRSDK